MAYAKTGQGLRVFEQAGGYLLGYSNDPFKLKISSLPSAGAAATLLLDISEDDWSYAVYDADYQYFAAEFVLLN